MKKTIEKLNALYEKEYQLDEEARGLREQQIMLCKKELLGKCFKIRERDTDATKREKYWKWVCFVRLTIDNGWRKEFYLTAVVVELCKINDVQDFGSQISEQSDYISEWISWLEDAEEATIEEFMEAKSRADGYINELLGKVVEEE